MPDPIDALLSDHAATVRETVERLRGLLRQAAPDARESIDLPDHLLAYGWSGRMGDLMFAIAPHATHVNLQLTDGAQLPDPSGIVEGTGKRIRHVKFRSVADVERLAVRALIKAQIAARPRPSE